jgi:ABC-type protease/lipase transport system fused ATPase/permease subunit
MPRQRRTPGARRESWRPRLAGIGIVLLLAAGGVAGYLVALHPAAARTAPPLSSKVTSGQAVGLIVKDSLPGSRAGQLLQLGGRQGNPAFLPVSPAQVTAGTADWTADLMAGNTGNTYIFIFVSNGDCLTAVGPAISAKLTLSRCDLAAAQRWRRTTSATKIDGHDFYQYASLAYGRCLTQSDVTAGQAIGATMAPCSASRPEDQLVAFWWSSV